MVTNTVHEVDAVLQRTCPIDESIPPATPRKWRTPLVQCWVIVS
jgi:hypothetical protein